MLADELGLECAFPLARDVNAQGACIGQYRLGAFAVAGASRFAWYETLRVHLNKNFGMWRGSKWSSSI